MLGIAKGTPLCRFKEGAQDAKHPSKGTIGFPSKRKLMSEANFLDPHGYAVFLQFRHKDKGAEDFRLLTGRLPSIGEHRFKQWFKGIQIKYVEFG